MLAYFPDWLAKTRHWWKSITREENSGHKTWLCTASSLRSYTMFRFAFMPQSACGLKYWMLYWACNIQPKRVLQATESLMSDFHHLCLAVTSILVLSFLERASKTSGLRHLKWVKQDDKSYFPQRFCFQIECGLFNISLMIHILKDTPDSSTYTYYLGKRKSRS